MSMLNMLSDHRKPTCPNCGMAKLSTEDIIWTNEGCEETGELREHHIGACPNCECTCSWIQVYKYEPLRYEDLEYNDEEMEED